MGRIISTKELFKKTPIPTRVDVEQEPRKKGIGFLGEIKRPDGGISTELSVGVNIDGKEIEIPTLIPTLTKEEVDYLAGGDKPTKAIIDKSVIHAQKRIAQGKSPFYQQVERKRTFSTKELFGIDKEEPFAFGAGISRGAGAVGTFKDDLPKFEPMDSHTRMQVTIQKLLPSFFRRQQRREQVISKGLSNYMKYAQPALKWAVSGMPEEEPERFEKMSWADVIRESYPVLDDPESPLARSVAVQFGAEIAGELLDLGTRPSTYLLWGVAERLIPVALRATFKKLPKGIQQSLIKERFIWGRRPIDLAYKELGLKKGASLKEVHKAYRKMASKWHPDKAPAGQSMKYTHKWLRGQGAYDKIKASTEIIRQGKILNKQMGLLAPDEYIAKVRPEVKPTLIKAPITPVKPIPTKLEPLAKIEKPQIIKQAQPKIKSISIPETSKQIGIDNKLNQQADDEIVKMYSGIPFTDKEIDWSKAKGLGLKIAKTVSVEYPFRQIGAKETGLAIKTYASKAESGQELSKDTIIKLGDKYKLNKSDWNELPFARELPEQFKKLSQEQQAKLKPALDEIDKIFTKYRKEGTERKYWDTGFPESRIRSLEDEAKSWVFKARKTKNPIEKTRIANQIAENYKAIDFLKHSGIKYVHLPVKLWISKLADTNPQLYTKLFSTKPKALYGRKTLKIQDLIDSKLIKKEDVDMRDILSNYIEYMERVKASDDIVRSAVKEGLAVFGEKEGYRTFPAYMFPEFSKYSFHPVFAEWLESTYTPFKKPSDINKIMAYAKLFTFTNPAFMGLTNAHQGIVGVGLKAIYPKTIKKAFKLLKNKPDEYWQAQKEGISSKPFRSPYEDFRKDIEYIKKKQDSTIPRMVFSAIQLLGKFTKNPIMTAYQTQWNLTWQYFDRIPRFITYSALRNEGWSIRDSAQLAAQFHGDYAGVPIKTRQFLNKILYTPTYRIAMTKLQTELVASIFKNTRPEMINIGKGGTFRRKALSSLAILIGALMGIDYSFRRQGWKREQFARRYYREIDTPEGKKEVVATLALPQNVMLRTMFRAGNISGVNPLLSSIRGFKWDLHPLWRVVALDIIATNRGSDNEPIYDPNALKNPNKAPKELIKIGWYATKEIVRMIGVFDQSAESAKRKKEAYSYARKDLNKIFYYILRPNMFAYLRKTEKQRKGMEAYILKKETIAKMRRLTDDEKVNEWAINLKEQIRKILE